MAEPGPPPTEPPAEPSSMSSPPPRRRLPPLLALGLAGIVASLVAAVVQRSDPVVQVVESGASVVELTQYEGEALSWGAVLGNPRTETAVGISIDLEILDRDGEVVDTQSESVAFIRPGETVGTAGWIRDVPQGVEVRVEVVRTSEWWPADDPRLTTIRVEDVELGYSHDNALIATYGLEPGPDTVMPVIELVLRDRRGRIIGGTFGYNPPQVGDEQPTVSTVAPFVMEGIARVDVYASPTIDTILD
jgi:hypothetical protein